MSTTENSAIETPLPDNKTHLPDNNTPLPDNKSSLFIVLNQSYQSLLGLSVSNTASTNNKAEESKFGLATFETNVDIQEEDVDKENEELNNILIYLTPQKQLIRLLIYLLFASFIIANALNFTNNRMPDPKKNPELPDLAFRALPRVLSLWHLTDLCVSLLLLFTLVTIIRIYTYGTGTNESPENLYNDNPTGFLARHSFLRKVVNAFKKIHHFLFYYSSNNDKKIANVQLTYEALILFISVYATMLIIRSIVLVMTGLPATSNKCQNHKLITNWAWNAFLSVSTLGVLSEHCGDLLFSGHTILTTNLLMTIWRYAPYTRRWIRVPAVIVYLLSWFSILISRSHYSVDVLIAFFLTFFLYKIFAQNLTKDPKTGFKGAPPPILFIISPSYSYYCIRNYCKDLKRSDYY